MELFRSLVVMMFVCTISAIIGALLVMLGTKRILGFSPSYPKAWVISFLHQIVGPTIHVTVYVTLQTLPAYLIGQVSIPLLIGIIISTFFAQAGITYGMINYENKTFINALKIMGIVWGLIALIILMLGITVGLPAYLIAGHR